MKAKKLVALALAGAAMIGGAGTANAALVINSITAANSDAPKATLKAGMFYKASNVRITPFTIDGVLDGNAVSLFSYCVDIFQYIGKGTFDVVSLDTFLGGDAARAKAIAALIANQGADGTTQHDAAVQLALWELLYEGGSTAPNLATDYFRIKYLTDPSVLTLANEYATLARTSWSPAADIEIHVARNGKYQDQLFFKRIPPPPPVPEPATWAMMIIGFGAAGGALRHRRQRTTTVSYA